jgi:glycosyltransferase involved in cell wall biosynthesis
MRIAVDIRTLLEINRAGVSLYALNLLRNLTLTGAHEYALFCNSSRLAFPTDAPAESGRVSHHFSSIPNRLLNLSFVFCDWPKIEKMVGGADAVYLPNLNFIATDKPLVVTVHDLSFLRYPQYFSLKQRLWHGLINAERMIGRAVAVVAVSEHTKRDIIDLFAIPERKIHVVSPAVGSEYYCRPPQETSAVRNKYGLPDRFILYLGTLEPRKNVTGLIEAFNRLPDDAGLVIAGAKGWLYKDIYAAAERSPKKDRIRFIGYVDERDKPALYSAATVFAYPSFYEGFGMPALEAMACGTPVVTSHTSSLSEVVGNAGLLVNPGVTDELVMAAESILHDQQFSRRLSELGIERAKLFTWEESARRLEGVFDTI